MITVGIPIYNAEKYLADAIKSVLAQTFQNWELILVDDGSKDKSLEIARDFEKQDSRIRVLSDGKNKKLPARLNQIIAESKGEYIARMDADDIMFPDRLEKQYAFLKAHQEYDLHSGGLVSIDDKNNIQGYRCSDTNITKVSLQTGFPIVHPTVMAKKDWYGRNKYSLDYPRAEDFELWCRASEANDLKLFISSEPLLFYREFGNLDANKLKNSYKDGLKIRRKFKGNNLKDSIRIKLKCLVVDLLSKTGNLQKLAESRNKKFETESEKNYFQLIIDNIVE